MSAQSPVYHESDYQLGKFKDGAWYCKHGDKAAERKAMNSRNLAYVGMRFWTCVNRPSCRFYLWEDHVVEALKYHQVPEDVIDKMSPRKRKRDRDITEYFPVTPKTPRTRDAGAHETDSEDDDIYEVSVRAVSPRSRHRESSPTPLPRRSNAPSRSLGPPSPPSSWEEALEEAVIQIEAGGAAHLPPPAFHASPSPRKYSVLNTLLSAPVITPAHAPSREGERVLHRPRTPPPTAQVLGNALAPLPAVNPRTPRRSTRSRPVREMPPPEPPTPGSGRRKLSAQELETYSVMIKALAGADVKLSMKGQNALRDIVKEEDFWIGS